MKKTDYEELLERGYIDIDKFSKDELYRLFAGLNREMTIIYHFVLAYMDYMNMGHDYQAEEDLTMLEAHLLTDICDIPNSTVTSLARSWCRSISATSQTIRKLITKGLVYRENSPEDAKVFYLRPTEKGLMASDAHKQYDSLDTIKTLKCLHHTLSYEEIETMFRGLKEYTALLHGEKP